MSCASRRARAGSPGQCGRARWPHRGADAGTRCEGEGGDRTGCAIGHSLQRRRARCRFDGTGHTNIFSRPASRPREESDGRHIGFVKTMSEAPQLLHDLLGAPGPSGYEGPANDVWRDAASFAEVTSDSLGSSVARIGERRREAAVRDRRPHRRDRASSSPTSTRKGFLYFAPIGGWDPQILLGQRVRGADQGRLRWRASSSSKPIHLLGATSSARRSPSCRRHAH